MKKKNTRYAVRNTGEIQVEFHCMIHAYYSRILAPKCKMVAIYLLKQCFCDCTIEKPAYEYKYFSS